MRKQKGVGESVTTRASGVDANGTENRLRPS